jgi:hypothetical protein
VYQNSFTSSSNGQQSGHFLVKECWNKWVVDKCWIDVINEWHEMPESIQITAVELNQRISRNAGFQAAGFDAATIANSLGIYKSSVRGWGRMVISLVQTLDLR